MVLSAQPALSNSTVPHLKPQISAEEGFQETPLVWNKAYRRTRLLPGHMVEAAPNAGNIGYT